MKVIGLIGGMSWESSAVYYQLINRRVQSLLGGVHNAKIIMYSLDFGEIEELQRVGNWKEMGRILGNVAETMEQAGAEMLVLCTNTMHKLAPAIEKRIEIPFIHIADVTGAAIAEKAMKTVALLGTQFTMEQKFYTERLKHRYDLNVITPTLKDRKEIHRIIYDELVKGIFLEDSRQIYLQIIQRLVDKGAEGIILGCTEIPLLISQEDCAVPVFNTTALHAEAAALEAMRE